MPLLERTSRLVALVELTTALGAGATREEALAAVLRIVMRELRAARGAVFGRDEDDGLVLWASHGLPPGAPPRLGVPPVTAPCALAPGDEAHDRHGLELLAPIVRRDRVIAVLGLGGCEGGPGFGVEQRAFLRAVVECVAAPIENGLLHGELRRARQMLSVKAFELHNLLDVSRELTGGFPEQAIQELVVTIVMGHFLVSRCALYLCGPQGLSLALERGLRRELESAPIPAAEVQAALPDPAPRAVVELPQGPLRQRLSQARLALAVPLVAGERVEGVLAIGERASGMPFSLEDLAVAQALARQGWAALENARLQRVREAKRRQDRELQIAREIQQSLFPPQPPQLAGFEVAGESRPCYEVGGDSYDWIPLGRDRLALVVADVAGKGTPASLLMASAHAFVHALAGTLAPDQVIERLNRFLFARTHASRFVTLFYAELDTAERRLSYVNAGHVPPFLVARGGAVVRLSEGGAALGLLPEEAYAVGELTLAPGDELAIVTDGVTEAMSPEEYELGDERVCATLQRLSGGSAAATLAGLVAAVDEWAGGRGRSDDLTALVLRAR